METLRKRYDDIYQEILKRVYELPAIDLREKLKDEYEDSEDLLFDLPYAFVTDKNGYYHIDLVIVAKKENGYFTCVETGEDFGAEHELSLEQMRTESLLEFLELATE